MKSLLTVIGLVVGFAVAWGVKPGTEPMYRDVIVSDTVIQRIEQVDTIETWRERIVYRTVPAETRATAPGGAVSDVEAFCRASIDSALAGREEPGDSIATPGRDVAPPPVLLARSVRFDEGDFLGFGRDKLIVTGPLSNGDLRQLTYSTRGSYQGHVWADTMFVQQGRFWWVRPTVEVAACFGAGYTLGRF